MREESLRDAGKEFRSLKRALHGRIRLGKNASLTNRAAVRVGDDFSIGIAAGVLI
jgi:hypothetical protein